MHARLEYYIALYMSFNMQLTRHVIALGMWVLFGHSFFYQKTCIIVVDIWEGSQVRMDTKKTQRTTKTGLGALNTLTLPTTRYTLYNNVFTYKKNMV